MREDSNTRRKVWYEETGVVGGVRRAATACGLFRYPRCYHGYPLDMQIIRSMYNTKYVLEMCEHAAVDQEDEADSDSSLPKYPKAL